MLGVELRLDPKKKQSVYCQIAMTPTTHRFLKQLNANSHSPLGYRGAAQHSHLDQHPLAYKHHIAKSDGGHVWLQPQFLPSTSHSAASRSSMLASIQQPPATDMNDYQQYGVGNKHHQCSHHLPEHCGPAVRLLLRPL
jgi:hypothetical protein